MHIKFVLHCAADYRVFRRRKIAQILAVTLVKSVKIAAACEKQLVFSCKLFYDAHSLCTI